MNLIICDYRVLAYSARDATNETSKSIQVEFLLQHVDVVFTEHSFISKQVVCTVSRLLHGTSTGGICVSWGAIWQPRYKLPQQVPKDTERQSANCHWCYLNRVVAVGGVSFTQCTCEVTVHYCDKNQTGASPIPGGSAGQRQGYGDRGQLSNESSTQTASSSLSEQ